MPNQYNFNILGQDRLCIEEGCKFGGPVWIWTEEKQKDHFLSHNDSAIVEGTTATVLINRRVRQMNCRDCGESFQQERRRGRPNLSCDECRNSE